MRIFDNLNAWELGGYQGLNGQCVKHNLILRTQKLSDMNDKQLKALIDVYHLKTVIDFRMTDEKERYPDPVLDGVTYYNVKILDEVQLKRAMGDTPDMNPGSHTHFVETCRKLLKYNVF